jgi:hypothetical protein
MSPQTAPVAASAAESVMRAAFSCAQAHTDLAGGVNGVAAG